MLLTVNGRLLLVGDGLKVPKEGRKMPAVKKLHQESSAHSNQWKPTMNVMPSTLMPSSLRRSSS